MPPYFSVEKLNQDKSFKKIPLKKLLKKIGYLLVWFFVVSAIGSLSYLTYLQRSLPDPGSISTRQVGESTKIYDRTGQVLLYDIHGEEKRTVIPWEEIPDYVKRATLASEDNNFYSHKGVDLRGIVRAFVANIRNAKISQGGSTITQQLVGNALVGRQQTFGRKIKELILAVEVEKRFTKDEIFWMYLNQIPYGSNAYGIEAASKTFFAKKAKDLTIAESALLTSLIKAPTYYSPYGNHIEELFASKDYVLKRMFDLSYITDKEYQSALGEKLVFKTSRENISAPHFVIMVKEYLASKYGEASIENDGYKITTTLDADLQAIADDIVPKYAKINKEKYKANNAALTAIDPKTGDILAMTGSADYFDTSNDGNYNVAIALRQPGSAFKPFAYAEAFRKGYPDSTILFDLKTEFNPNCSPDANGTKDKYGLDCYNPQDYDGLFRGPVTMRQALDESLNVPSVETLYLAGIPDTIDLAESMGISTLGDRGRFGLSLVLGGAEVKLVDITSAYSVFANEGVRNPWQFIKRVEAPDGTILEEAKEQPKRVIEAQVADLINDVLSDNNARAPVFGSINSLHIPGVDLAAKTGTTQENRDAWVVGYSSSLAVGIWTGNNNNTSMTKAGAGISAAGPMWNEFMRRSFDKYPPSPFTHPDPVFTDKVMLNGSYNGPSGIHSILYYVTKSNPLGPQPINPTDDPQYNNWEQAVRTNYGL